MSQEDLRINRDVRKILVKHWLDLGRLSVRSSLGRLMIRGSLERIRGVKEELTPAIVNEMFRKIKQIKNVVRVSVELDNWANDDGRWVPVDRTKKAGMLAPQSTAGTNPKAGEEEKKKKREEEEEKKKRMF